ncbi:double zinc ribbon domain-containing protein [Wolbachia endosymbiont of Ctenocephalides felis wCfeT]|uniref:double zinc ribbon domain-containing protein n=1 Tax=Wolbachia endosymbiont of Ctenocephalides felis wCfeT TaxID=2732593 RepID=UPI001FEAE7C2|nr:double zinc ribbon domain-containing protein [Wolbachia endosymbiont of Ctenocephalides felis wCfeT]
MSLLKKAIDVIFPNVCISCECIIERSYDLCSKCHEKINFLTKHYCNVCGAVITDVSIQVYGLRSNSQ